jgi:hypothetical protein
MLLRGSEAMPTALLRPARGVMHGRAVWNGPPGSEPVEGEGGPDAAGVIRKTRRDARARPAEPDRQTLTSAPSIFPTIAGDVPLPEGFAHHADALATLGTAWAIAMMVNATHRENMEHAEELIGELRNEIAGLRIANAELKAALAEVRSKSNETAFVVDRLRIENKGPPGERGLMGRDGRDGAIGPPGPRGNRGQRGFEIIGWQIDVAGYQATPQFYDGSEGPPLNMRPFFERYNADTEGDEIELAAEQLAHSRAELEYRTERVRKGLPER